DLVGVVGSNLVDWVDGVFFFVAIGICLEKSLGTSCLMRQNDPISRPNVLPKMIYYLKTNPNTITSNNPFTDPTTKIFQHLNIKKNNNILNTIVNLEHTILQT